MFPAPALTDRDSRQSSWAVAMAALRLGMSRLERVWACTTCEGNSALAARVD